ncbi:hypothetical protein J1N35_031440 [Gossypium stocksii]|uniref:RNase H type-1 domain-containing protein n=1 Tax=Gossypium stocksii TaxID=47602 RepID=A0A9D3V1F5_9ROSI|nr:hypothetical protein J1N35_031440 [Gossypium stocksii]
MSSATAGFQWGQTGAERKIHCKAWHFLACPKAESVSILHCYQNKAGELFKSLKLYMLGHGKLDLGLLFESAGTLVDGTSLNSPEMTKALALKLGVEYARKRNFEKIILENDSQTMHDEFVTKKGKHRWKLKHIIVLMD